MKPTQWRLMVNLFTQFLENSCQSLRLTQLIKPKSWAELSSTMIQAHSFSTQSIWPFSARISKIYKHGFSFTILAKRMLPNRLKNTQFQAFTQVQENQNKLDSSTFFPTKTATQVPMFHCITLEADQKKCKLLKFLITQCLNTKVSL